MEELLSKLLQTGSFGLPTALVFLYFKLHKKVLDKEIADLKEDHGKDLDKVSDTIAECSNHINKLAGTVETFVKWFQRVVSKQDSSIKDLYDHKDIFVKEIAELKANLKPSVKQEKKDSETTEFKKKNLNTECLLIEDDPDVLQYMREGLKDKLGFKVTCADDITEALNLLENQMFDCAVLDFYVGEHTAEYFIDKCIKKNKLMKKTNNGKKQPKILLYTGKQGARAPMGVQSIEKPFKWTHFRQLMECVIGE